VSLLAEGVIAAVRELLTTLFSEPVLLTDATYHSRSGSTTETDRNKPKFTDTELSVIVTNNAYENVIREKLPFVQGNVDILILADGAPDNMTARDKITIAGNLRGITKVVPYLGVAYGLVTEGED